MKILIFLGLILLNSCTHYQAMPTEDIVSKRLPGLWKMTVEPYYFKISCEGEISFHRPTTTFLYADQIGSKYLITSLSDDEIITGPIFRSAFKMEAWPSDSNGQVSMIVDGRKWYLAEEYKCN